MGIKSLLLVSWTFLLFSSIACGQESFSDRDLERYKGKSDSDPAVGQAREESPSDNESSKLGGNYSITSDNKDYWCHQGERARSEISTANKNAAAAQERYTIVVGQLSRASDMYMRVRISKERDEAKRQLDAANDAVDQANKTLELLESEAQKKGIPPGWLKCNFN